MHGNLPSSDKEVFEFIKWRLENDVGEIIKFTFLEREKGRDWMAWWALFRMLFPIAEALGDLIHGEEKSSSNLYNILSKDLAIFNPSYSKVAALITLLRHSFVHKDEIGIIHSNGKIITWKFSFGNEHRINHLKLEIGRSQPPSRTIYFDTTQFYDDLISLCTNKIKDPTLGAKERYEGWFMLNLDTQDESRSAIKKQAKNEIRALFN